MNQDIAYLAGIIDGEGYISIYKTNSNKFKRKPTYGLKVVITVTSKSLIEFLKFNFGGCIQILRKLPARKQAYRWSIANNQAALLLEKVFPFLIIKRAEVKLALKFQADVRKRSHWYGSGGLPDKVANMRHKCYTKLKLLKK